MTGSATTKTVVRDFLAMGTTIGQHYSEDAVDSERRVNVHRAEALYLLSDDPDLALKLRDFLFQSFVHARKISDPALGRSKF